MSVTLGPMVPEARVVVDRRWETADTVRERLGSRAGSAYRAGRRNIDLLEAYTGKPATELDASYRAFIDQITRVGTGEKVMRGDSPLEQ